jgi:hypothetical protein
MADTTRIRLQRYPRPPNLAHFLRVYFQLGDSYDVPTDLAHALIAGGDAVLDRTDPVQVREGDGD